MASTRQLLVEQTPDRFAAIVGASPKKFREELFRRVGIRSKKGGAFALSNAKKNEVRIQKLYEALGGDDDIQDDVFDELVRNYLFTLRPMLAEALDFFGVEHDDGLTDAELDFLEELPAEKITLLRDLLTKNHDAGDVELYLRFMNIG